MLCRLAHREDTERTCMGISNDLWKRIEPLIPASRRTPDRAYRRRPGGGRKARDQREVFDAVLHVLLTRCAWHELPPALGSVSTVNRHFRHWDENGLFDAIWAAGLAEHPELRGIHWTCEPAPGPGQSGPRWRPVHGGRRGRPRKHLQARSPPATPLTTAPAPAADVAASSTDALVQALRVFISRDG